MNNFILRGQRILLNRPIQQESVIKLSPELEEEFALKEIKKWKNLEVFAIGDEVVGLKEGDKVYVSLTALQNAEFLEIENEQKILVRFSDITIIWKN